MTTEQMIFTAAVVAAALSVWLLLPGAARRGYKLGAGLGLVSLGLFGSQLPRLATGLDEGVFGVLAAVTLVAAVASMTARNPVYCAIWFALVLLGVAGLFLYQGAEFLGVATVVVYAGAILVTFLFVLMLAQPEGQAYYDRISWEPLLSAATGAVLIGMLTTVLGTAFEEPLAVIQAAPLSTNSPELVEGVLAPEHVASLGAQMFSKHLISVQAAGALLLAALVGAVAIIAQGKKLDASRGATPGGTRHG